MSEPSVRRVVLVAAAPGRACADVADALADLGIETAPSSTHVELSEMVRDPLLEQRTPSEELRRRARALLGDWLAHAPSTLVWHDEGLALRIGFWREVAADLGAEPVVVLAWEHPDSCAGAVPQGVERAQALARWERVNRSALSELWGKRCIVVPVDVDAQVAMRAVVGVLDATLVPDPPMVAHDARAGGGRHEVDAAARASFDVLPSQRRLEEVLTALSGSHAALPEMALPPESSWTAAVVDAERRAREHAEDAERAWRHAHATSEGSQVLWRALWQVSDELVVRTPVEGAAWQGPDRDGGER